MLQARRLNTLGIFFLYAVLLVIGTHWCLGDQLLFHSDPWSLTIYVSAAALAALPLLIVASTPIVFASPERRQKLFELAVAVLAVVITATSLRLVTSLVTARKIDPWATLICVGLAVAIIRKQDLAGLREKIEKLCLAGGFSTLLVLPLIGFQVWNEPNIKKELSTPNKHLTMLVLDGLPPQHLNTYNPHAKRTTLDDVLSQGHVLKNMRTSRPFTYGFFGTFYGGRTAPIKEEVGPRSSWQRVRKNRIGSNDPSLIGTLQRNGVHARWICFHRNGVPEASAAHRSDYHGLRSYFLTENYAWIPEALNLDYHVKLYRPRTLKNQLGRVVYGWLNYNSHVRLQNVFTEVLLPQIKSQQASGKPTFNIFHINWPQAAQANIFIDGIGFSGAQSTGDELGKAVARIRKNEYQYDPSQEHVAIKKRLEVENYIDGIGVQLAEFLKQLRNNPNTRDVTVMLAADHGSMYEKGRFWYGYHPNEEVVRTPFALLNVPEPRVDDRLFTTPAITASVLDYFDVPRVPHVTGRSIFEFSSDGQELAATVTMNAEQHREWFLIVVKDGVKYLCNLHPDGNGETTVLNVSDFTEQVTKRTRGVPTELVDVFPKALGEFDIYHGAIHPAFHKAYNSTTATAVRDTQNQRRR